MTLKSHLTSTAMISIFALALGSASWAQAQQAAPAPQAQNQTLKKPHNVIIFIADGLRSGMVTPQTAPTLAMVRDQGVNLINSHAVYPTVTTVNASAIATGHGIGDTGEFQNTLILLPNMKSTYGSLLGGMEDDAVLSELNGRMDGNYLNEISLLRAARDKGFNTAAIGKEGPILIQDLGASDGQSTIIIDDETGVKGIGVPVRADILAAMKAQHIPLIAEQRGLNGGSGAYNMAGTLVPNKVQQDWFIDVATKVVLPKFKADDKPFALVYWSRDPDGTQHNQGDSLGDLIPGINGPTSLAAIRNASDNLAALIDTLKQNGLYETTDIFVTADHGFATISKESKTSAAAKMDFSLDTRKGDLPSGFLAIDLAKALKMKLWDAYGLKPVDPKCNKAKKCTSGQHPNGMSLIGDDPKNPDMTVVFGGGSDVIYLNPSKAKTLAPKIIEALTRQDYVGALFARDDLGDLKGALTFSDVGLVGTAKTPLPAIMVSFKTFSTGCENPEICAALVGDTPLQQGQGMHGSLSRAESHNFMAAIGPDFKSGYINQAPVSNADIAPTLAQIIGVKLDPKGKLIGRPIDEALKDGGEAALSQNLVKRSTPADNGFVTVLETQKLGDEIYLDAAGMPGRVVGLKTQK